MSVPEQGSVPAKSKVEETRQSVFPLHLKKWISIFMLTRPVLDRFHDSSKVNALSFMLYALCSMLYVPCFMFHALCSMLYVLCFKFYALCSMLYVQCFMFHTGTMLRTPMPARKSPRMPAHARACPLMPAHGCACLHDC